MMGGGAGMFNFHGGADGSDHEIPYIYIQTVDKQVEKVYVNSDDGEH